jgi:hypothetical protein
MGSLALTHPFFQPCLEYAGFVAKPVKNGSLAGQEYLDTYPAAVNQQPGTPKFSSTDYSTLGLSSQYPFGTLPTK